MERVYQTYLFTGRPSAGKTTVVNGIYNLMTKEEQGKVSKLDGDILRDWLNNDLGFSHEDRIENLRRFAGLANFVNYEIGKDVFGSFVSPTNEHREVIKKIIGPDKFKLIYVEASLKVCEERDVKGMYKKARENKIKSFTGIHDDAPFEEPINPNLILNTEKYSIEQCVDKFFDFYNSLNSK